MTMRKAFLMRVNPDAHDEYVHRHDPIWKELEQVFEDHGVLSYSIYLEPKSSQLFAYVEIESEEEWQKIPETDICKRWWVYMKDLMPTNAGNSPVSTNLQEVFHLD
jgi:L-rhamnose mutarotase